MLPFPLQSVLRTLHCDAQAPSADKDYDTSSAKAKSKALNAITSLKQAVSAPEPELRRWRRTFDTFAKVTVNDEK